MHLMDETAPQHEKEHNHYYEKLHKDIQTQQTITNNIGDLKQNNQLHKCFKHSETQGQPDMIVAYNKFKQMNYRFQFPVPRTGA